MPHDSTVLSASTTAPVLSEARRWRAACDPCVSAAGQDRPRLASVARVRQCAASWCNLAACAADSTRRAGEDVQEAELGRRPDQDALRRRDHDQRKLRRVEQVAARARAYTHTCTYIHTHMQARTHTHTMSASSASSGAERGQRASAAAPGSEQGRAGWLRAARAVRRSAASEIRNHPRSAVRRSTPSEY